MSYSSSDVESGVLGYVLDAGIPVIANNPDADKEPDEMHARAELTALVCECIYLYPLVKSLLTHIRPDYINESPNLKRLREAIEWIDTAAERVAKEYA